MSGTTLQESAAPYGRTIAAPKSESEQRVVLHNVQWSTYKSMLKDLGDSRACRMAFDSGELEIMSPHYPHESSQFGIGQLVPILVEEFGCECVAAGALTCQRDDLQKAIEPDGCFYIQHFNAVKGLQNIDLSKHPPPDLMIEVDMSTNSMNKLAICAALGVSEHWRFDGKTLEIRLLKGGRYFESAQSSIFPGLPLAAKVAEFLEFGRNGIVSMNRQFRAWIRSELRKSKPIRTRKSRP